MTHVARLLSLGVLLALLAAGCMTKPGEQRERRGAAHDHPDHGPHGGALVEWGEEDYHPEFTVDHAKKQATVYILDRNAKKASPIATETITLTLTHRTPPVQVTLKADPQEGDPAGSASRFVGTHEELATEMEFKGEISGKVGDKPYAGTFAEKPHDHEPKKK